MTTLGFIGSGLIGGTLAELATAKGYEVVVSNSRGPETLADLVEKLGTQARAATSSEAAAAADLAVVSVPFKSYVQVPVEPLAGKIVIDTNNYYHERDDHFEALDEGELTSSELLQQHLPTSKIVKAFNNINWKELAVDGRPAGTPGRRALPIAGDDAEAKRVVTALIDELGFDVIDAGPLADSWRFQRDMPCYGVRTTVSELTESLAQATR